MWEVSFAVDCQTKIVKCDCAANENFEVTITVLSFGCVLNQQSALVKEILGSSKVLEFCHLERYE